MLLGNELDRQVQSNVRATREVKGAVTTTVVWQLEKLFLVIGSNQQGILGHLSDFDETYYVCSTYGAHHPYQLLTTCIT